VIMNFRELLTKFTDDKITKRLVELYPDQKKCKKGYLRAIIELRHIKPAKSKIKIRVEHVHEEGPPFYKPGESEDYVRVDGFDDKEPNWGLDLTRWSEWLAMEVAPNKFSDLDSVCHILWEMTFHGWSSKSVGGMTRLLNGRMKDIISGKAKTVSYEDAKKEMGLV